MESNQKAVVRKELPTVADVYADVERINELQGAMALFNAPPKPEWLKDHPTAKVKNKQGQFVPAKYIPINITESLLNYFFPTWSVEVIDYKLIANSVAVHVRLHLLFPDVQMRYFDGVGAAPLQTDSGAGAIEFDKIKSAAVQMALPSAKSYAIKDAADHIGKIFGKDINREQMEQASFEIKDVPDASDEDKDFLQGIYTELQTCSTLEELSAKGKELKAKIKLLKKSDYVNEEFIKLGNDRKNEILKGGTKNG
jgi:hypothetical protein